MTESNSNLQNLSYATPDRAGPSPLTAAVWIAVLGLGLVVLGGCFMIGVMFSNQLSNRNLFFTIALYVCAAVCFGGAMWALIAGLSRLWGISQRR